MSRIADVVRMGDDPGAAARDRRTRGGAVVGYIGPDVPIELIVAAGMLPLRLQGDPSRPADASLRHGPLDPVTGSVLDGLAAGAYPIDFLVIDHSRESHVRLFHLIRELERIGEPACSVPVAFFDLLHLRRAASDHYTRLRLAELSATLAGWAGAPIAGDAIVEAIARRNEVRMLLREILSLRSLDAPTITGVEALAITGASLRTPWPAQPALLRQVQEEARARTGVQRARVFLTGSAHDHPAYYAALEAAGHIVVGEDHDWGDPVHAGLVATDRPVLEALREAYQHGPPDGPRYGITERAEHTLRRAATARADVVLALIRTGDEALLWDLPETRRRLATASIPLVVVDEVPYTADVPGTIVERLRHLRS